jgi:hypothetical protein
VSIISVSFVSVGLSNNLRRIQKAKDHLVKKQASSLVSRTANAKSDAEDIEAFRKEIQLGMDMILVRFGLSTMWLHTD